MWQILATALLCAQSSRSVAATRPRRTSTRRLARLSAGACFRHRTTAPVLVPAITRPRFDDRPDVGAEGRVVGASRVTDYPTSVIVASGGARADSALARWAGSVAPHHEHGLKGSYRPNPWRPVARYALRRPRARRLPTERDQRQPGPVLRPSGPHRCRAASPWAQSLSAKVHVKSYGGAVSPSGLPPRRTSARPGSEAVTTRGTPGTSLISSPTTTSCHSGVIRSAL